MSMWDKVGIAAALVCFIEMAIIYVLLKKRKPHPELEKAKHFLKIALSEGDGSASSTRLLIFYMGISFITVIAGGFIMVVVWHPDIIVQYLATMLLTYDGALGIKVWQYGKENQ